MTPRTGDTIVAVASPPGRAPRGLIRASGSESAQLLGGVLGRDDPPTWPSHRLRRIVIPLPPEVPAHAAVFHAPASFTGETAFEIQLPGHPALLERVLERLREAGARLAEPGEFSFRALIRGAMDLTRAEGVNAAIAAESDAELSAAERLRAGELGDAASGLVARLGELLARLEAGIDFADEEDVVAVPRRELLAELESIRGRLEDLLARSRRWGEIEALPRVALVGPPSAGKSSLFNALLGRPRALVRAESGTTRDVLTERVVLERPAGGAPVAAMVSDMAGLDAPETALDRAAQRNARAAIEAADLLLAVHDASAADPRRAEPAVPGQAVLAVAAKADLADRAEGDLAVSARTGAGLGALRRAIAERIGARRSGTSGALTLRPRHVERIETALARIRAVEAAPDVGSELAAASLREALDALAAIGGTMSPDDVLGRVFATFCIGK